jgi:hypothetical protein
VHVQTVAAYSSYGAAIGFERLCTAPCEPDIDPGRYSFAVEFENGSMRAVRGQVTVEAGGTYRVGRESRRMGRIIYWSIMSACAVAGAAMLAVGVPRRGEGAYGVPEAHPITYVGAGLISIPFVLLVVPIIGIKDRGTIERVSDAPPERL